MPLTMKQRGIITLIGGFMIELVTGSVFLWGQLNVYITSYFRQKEDSDLKLSIGGAIFPVMMASLATGIPLGIKGIKFFGSARISCIVSSVIASSSVFISSYTERFWQFILIYGIIHGVAQGSIYFVPIYMGYLYFPNNKGLVSGIVTGGFAICSFIFGLIFFSLVNPNGLTQVKNDDGFSYFEGPSIEVARNVPETLRKMSYMYLGVAIFSAMFLLYHPNQIGEEEKILKQQLIKKQLEEKIVQENIEKINKSIQEDEKQHLGVKNAEISNKQGLNILSHTLQIVKLEEKVIQKKIIITHLQDEQASFENPFPKVEETNQNNTPASKGLTNQRGSLVFVDRCIEDQHQNIMNIFKFDQEPNKIQHTNPILEDFEEQIQKLNENTLMNLNNDQIQKFNENLNNKEILVKQDLELTKKKEEEIQAFNKLGAPSASIALKQPQLYMSILLGILSLGLGVLVNGNYKSIAKDYGFTNDSYQALVGSLGGVANGLSRPMWSTLLDKFTFKQIISVIHIIQIICAFTLQFTDVSEVFFIIWVFIIHMTMGAVLGMWPVLSAQLNGVKAGSQLFGLYWYGFSCATLLQFFLVYSLKTEIGFINLYYIYAIQSILALIIVQLYKFKVNWSKYYIQQQIMEEQKTHKRQKSEIGLLQLKQQNNNDQQINERQQSDVELLQQQYQNNK